MGPRLHLRIGFDAIMGCNRNIFLSEALVHHLQLIAKTKANLITKLDQSTLWRQGWKKSLDLGIGGDLVYPWDLLSAEIQKAHIKLRRVLDECIWALNKT